MKRFSPKKLAIAVAMTAALTAAAAISASACTTIYVGADRTQEGTPFVARTEDYGQNMNKLWFVKEAGHWKKGATYVGCPEYGAFEWTFRHDSYRFTHFTNDTLYDGVCPECGQGSKESPVDHPSYTEFGTNEKGVSVSATETIYGREEITKSIDPFVQEKKDGKVGIEETDIPTILLAEADSARAGVDLLLEIYRDYGAYFASGVFIADQNETWYIENCSGTQYIAIRLPDDMIFLEPNMAVIGRVNLNDKNIIASDKLIQVAEQAGTFVGDKDKGIIDFRASYAGRQDRVDQRMVDGLNYLNKTYGYTADQLLADNSRFTITNVDEKGAVTALRTAIVTDRTGDKLDKNDVFGYYKLSTIGKPSNQEIEIFQLFKDRPVETGTVGWVGVGNMSHNVFVPYYPMLITDSSDLYAGYQVSTATVTKSKTKPASGFCTWQKDRSGDEWFVSYPANWKDSYYFSFEGLGGYILNAKEITGKAVSAKDDQYVLDQMNALQQQFNDTFQRTPADQSVEASRTMAKQAHAKALEMIDYLMAKQAAGFTDVPEDAYFAAPVAWAVDKNITSGLTANTFGPSASCTRAQAVTFLWKAAGSPAPKSTAHSFSDVKAGSWYETAVLWAVENGITSGTSASTFSPDAPCTRAQIVTFLWKAQSAPAAETANGFADVAADAWYFAPVQWAVKNGVTSGTSASTFSPSATCTRAQIITFLYQAMK